MSKQPQYRVEHTTNADLESVYTLFDQSVAYQEKHGYPLWANYDKGTLIRDVAEGNQYKIVVDSQLGIVFSVGYLDHLIWKGRDKGDAIYLHRIVVNPHCKGQRLFGRILDWSVQHALERGLKFVRMDTWDDNPPLIDYYKTFGFAVVGNVKTPDSPELPVHNRNLKLVLLEIGIRN